jgi:ADP-ribosylglycohydrolase
MAGGDATPEAFISRGWDDCLSILSCLKAAVHQTDPETDPCRAAGRGWVADEVLATALLCFLMFVDDPLLAVRRAACSSGDSDSIAALTGAFAGAHRGFEAWPSTWINRVECREELLGIGKEWDEGWELRENWLKMRH